MSKHVCADQSGTVEVFWAHNPEADGLKPSSDNVFILYSVSATCKYIVHFLLFLMSFLIK